MKRTVLTAAAAVVLLAGTASAATSAQSCAGAKNLEAGKYVACRQKAEAKFALGGDAAARAIAIEKCVGKYAKKWPVIETRAGGMCASTGDQAAIQDYLDTASTDVAAALAGGALAGQAQPLKTGQTGCWDGAGQPIACDGTGQDGAFQRGVDRVYVDNGDGTVTDTSTGLMWEKLSDDTGIHDKDNTYTWANAFAYKIATLNFEAFAGYTDWRVPNITELLSIVDFGKVGPAVSSAFNTNCAQWCTVLTCSCTLGGHTYWFWSSSSFQTHPSDQWAVFFYNGVADRTWGGAAAFHVRAVRGGA